MIPTVLPNDYDPITPDYINIPVSINGIPFQEYISNLESCLESKGGTYYKKIVGGMRCSNIELVKLELIIYLLKRYTRFYGKGKETVVDQVYQGLPCMYNGTQFSGMVYGTRWLNGTPKDWETYGFTTPLSSETYLQTFVNYASEFCKDCIVSNPVVAAAVPASTAGNLYGEDGTTPITLETGGTIKL